MLSSVTTVGDYLQHISLWVFFAAVLISSLAAYTSLYILLLNVAPKPRPSTTSEKTYITVLSDGSTSKTLPLPCWYDSYTSPSSRNTPIEPAEVFLSVVIPAYNEQERLPTMLDEAVAYLEANYPSKGLTSDVRKRGAIASRKSLSGYEIILVSDGSRDKTVETALNFAKNYGSALPLRVVTLEENRGKGGAVTHGLRHVRGQFSIFADADGATRFSDLGKLVEAAEKVVDEKERAVVIGSRAHLVGSEEVVKRSMLRNALMYTFHLFIRLLTTRLTSRIGDTQCGFKLFTRNALPDIVPYMHSEGWIFDVEMLMLAEAAAIPIAEVSVGWHEIKGSKLNVIWDSLGMAFGLAVIRASWELGIWKRSL